MEKQGCNIFLKLLKESNYLISGFNNQNDAQFSMQKLDIVMTVKGKLFIMFDENLNRRYEKGNRK